MDLKASPAASDPGAAMSASLPAGIDHTALENDGPKAFGDRMGTPAPDEKVLWKGRPDLGMLARSAFHTRTLGLYMAGLIAIALVMGRTDAALVAGVLGAALLALLYLLAWLSARSTLYILTDARLIMRIGMAIETRINIPLKQITAAHFRARSNGHGDIAFELNGERLLGTLLLWPHVRPQHYTRPQPMLRSIPEAAMVAQMIAENRAEYGAIEQNLAEIKDAPTSARQLSGQPTGQPVRVVQAAGRADHGFEGAPA